MKLKNYAYRCMAVVCAIVAVACVDEEFSFDKVSTEVSVLDGKTVLPVGTFEKQTLGDLLKDVDLSKLTKNEDGSYTFTYEVEPQTLSPGDVELPTSFAIEEMGSNFDFTLPSVNFSDYGVEVNENFALDLELGAFEDVLSGGESVEITEFMLNLIPEENRKLSASTANKVKVSPVQFTLPEQIKNVNAVHFVSKEQGHTGAPLHLNLQMNGLAGVNGGGHFDFVLRPTASQLVIYDKDNNLLECDDQGYFRMGVDVAVGSREIDFTIYIASIVNTSEPDAEGNISIDPSMEFDLSYELKAQAGILSTEVPRVTVQSDFKIEDVEVFFDSEYDLVNIEFGGSEGEEGAEGFAIEIDSLPEMVKNISCIELDESSILTLFAEGFEWLEGNEDFVTIDITLPECLVLRPIGDDYQYDEATHKLTMDIGAISDGLQIAVEAIDFGADGIAAADGPISIDFSPVVRVHFSNDNAISINDFIPEGGSVKIAVGLRESELGFKSVTAELDFSGEIVEDIEIGETGELPVEIGGIGLSPVLQVTVTNPLTIDANFSATLIPYMGEEAKDDCKVSFDATIRKAVHSDEAGVVPTTTTIVLAKESYRDQYEALGYTFCVLDIDKLLSEGIPSKLSLVASYGLPKEAITLYLTDNIELSYGASLSLPIAFDDKLSITYEDKIDVENEDDGSIISRVIRNNAVKVGDIALIAEIETTLPLEFVVTTTLYDKDGNVLPTKLGFVEGSNTIAGPADGATPTKSPVRLTFDLADESGSLNELADIASIGLKLAANGVSEVAASLKDDQYVAAVLKFEVAGGITLDLGKIKDKAEEEIDERFNE